MNVDYLTGQLKSNAQGIDSLVRHVTDDQAGWKPDPNAWSILEVINHLLDEEREDFRVRLDIILYHSNLPWPAIDPEGWVVERKYNMRYLQQSLNDYLTERKSSLQWLDTLDHPDWDKVYTSPFGSMEAGDMLASWVAHDQLHMRQLIELHRAYTEVQAGPFSLDYAGEW